MYRKEPVKSTGPFVLPFCMQKASFFSGPTLVYAFLCLRSSCPVPPIGYMRKEAEHMRRINWKKPAAVAAALALSTALLAGCGSTAASSDSMAESTTVSESESTAEEAEEGDADEVAAKNCADLIDAIYVQERTDDTDAQCEAAKAAWDALTDTQKEMVEGENADPEYFGRDTGDASKDDPRNEDEIGENELLVVSFGTSFNGSRAADIKGIEDALQAANPDWSVRRAFTAQIIINHVQARDGEKIDNMEQALDRAVANGVKNLVVQPTHLMHGAEYDEMCEAIDEYKDKFESVSIAEPLLGEVGADATVINEDKEAVATAITTEAVKTAGHEDAAAAAAASAFFSASTAWFVMPVQPEQWRQSPPQARSDLGASPLVALGRRSLFWSAESMARVNKAPGARIMMEIWNCSGMITWPNTAPAPTSSRHIPMTVRDREKPRPIPRPSKKDSAGPFLQA